jgi:DNA-binding transcriptional LysR family regulator
MFLYCGAAHALFPGESANMGWDDLRRYAFAGLGYHSPNMEISQQVHLTRRATGYDQESIATLILSGKFLGFLPDHYAEGFVRQGQMRAIQPDVFHYNCSFFSILRRSPPPSRVTRAFQDCLLKAHSVQILA